MSSSIDFEPVVIGIAGGSGSGKTSISDAVVNRIGTNLVSKLTHDSYYRDLSHLTFDERKETNFDHPDALETELLIKDLKKLKSGETVGVPVYDFTTHSRRANETIKVAPTPVIVLDGILIYSDQELRDLIDIKIFVDTDADIRFIRRLKRDTLERGRTMEDVSAQYLSTVRPMHIQFVEPTKRFADIIIPEGGYDSHIAMDLLIARMQDAIAKTSFAGCEPMEEPASPASLKSLKDSELSGSSMINAKNPQKKISLLSSIDASMEKKKVCINSASLQQDKEQTSR